MKITDVKTPNDVLEFMKSNIKYGWLDYSGEEHIGNMDNFRKLYRTSSIEETLKHGIGTCIEQVMLMKVLLDRINIPNKMFCSRIYEKEDFNDMDSEEHMHCFILYYDEYGVHQIEHPNFEKVGIYHYNSEEEAIKDINNYYEKKDNGQVRSVTEFFEVKPGLSFKEFNTYINSLDIYNSKKMIK